MDVPYLGTVRIIAMNEYTLNAEEFLDTIYNGNRMEGRGIMEPAKELTVQAFIEMIENASTCHYLWDEGNKRLMIRVDGEPETYVSPSVPDMSEEEFVLFTSKLETLAEE